MTIDQFGTDVLMLMQYDAMAESAMPLASFQTLLGKRFLSLMENK